MHDAQSSDGATLSLCTLEFCSFAYIEINSIPTGFCWIQEGATVGIKVSIIFPIQEVISVTF